jgi:hypothetical protein
MFRKRAGRQPGARIARNVGARDREPNANEQPIRWSLWGGTDQDHRARTSLGPFTTLARLVARAQLNPSLFAAGDRIVM